MSAEQAQRLAAGSVPVGMAVLPGGVAQAESSANGPWLLLVTANVRACLCSSGRSCLAYVADVPKSTGSLLQGLAKRVALNDLPQKNRGGAGYYLLKTNEGDRLVALHVVGSAGIHLALHARLATDLPLHDMARCMTSPVHLQMV